MSRLSCHSQRAAAMSREEMTEMVRILDKKDYDGRKQVYKQPVIRKNYILDRVISSLEDKYHVQRTKNQLQRRWSDLKLREENVLEQIRTKIRKQKKKDRKRRERGRQRQLEEDVLNEEEDNTATADGGNVNATVVKDNAGEEEVAGYPDEPDQDILAVDAAADVSQEDRLELRDLQQPGFIILVPVPNQDVGQPQTEASDDINRKQEELQDEEIAGPSTLHEPRETISIGFGHCVDCAVTGEMSTSGYWMAENGSPTDRDNVFIERVKTYSPITKTVQVLDSPGPMSPASPGYQSVMWAPEPQIIQEVQSPGPYTQGTIRRYIVQSPEQEIQAPYSQGTLRRYIVQNPEQNVQQETVRQYIVQNPEQNVQQETVRRYVVQNPEQNVQQETVRQYIVQNPEQNVQQETVRQYIVQNPEQNVQQETVRQYIVQNPEQNVQQETVRQYIVQNPEQNVQQETVRRYVVQNPEQNVQQETVRQYIVQNPEQDVQHGTVRRYIVQNPDQSYMQGVNYLPSNHMIYEKTIRRMDKPSTTEERQATIVRGSSVSSVNEQVIEQNNQNKVTVQSTEEVISEQNVKSNYQEKVNLQMDQVQRRSSSVSEQLDARYFGELLAELSRKNNDLYSLLLQHVERMGARKPSDSEQQEDIESLIPKGVSELTKQQIRYLLQMRQTSDKSTRLVLATFSSLKEELGHLQEDLNKLEVGKKSVERDLTFKDNQIREYETMLATLRDKNRQQQQELKDSQMKLRSLEETIQTLRNADSDKEYRLKELEYARNTLQQENKTLRVQVSETVSNPMLQAKTDEITRHYKEMIDSLREEKDKEIRSLRTQITKFQHDVTAREGSSSDLQMRLLELTASLEERDAQLKRQQEELFRLRQQSQVNSVTQEVITNRYSTQYPILRLLNDYKETPGYRGQHTVVVERRQGWKAE